MEACIRFVKPGMPAATLSNACSLLVDLSDGIRAAEENVELQWNKGLLGFALVAFFGHFWIRFLHCVRTICKIKIWLGARDTTTTQRSTVHGTISWYGRLHSGTLPRLDASGFQMPYHCSVREGPRESYFPPVVKKQSVHLFSLEPPCLLTCFLV